MKKISLLSLGLSSLAFNVQAGSFQLPNQGLDQLSMGGTGAAHTYNATSMFYNPALMSRMKDFQISGNIILLKPQVRYTSNVGTTQQDNITKLSTPFSLYLGGKFNPSSRWAYGLAVYTPFGSNLNWGNNWAGRYLVQSISLSTIYVQPTVSYEISEKVSVGAGVNYGFGNLEMTKALPVTSTTGDGQVLLQGKAQGIGFNLGLHIQPTENISIGLNYRSGTDMKIKNGTAKFTVPNSLVNNFPNTNFTTQMNLPNTITLGLAAKVTPDFMLAADFIYSTWSRYESTNFDFEINTPSLQDQFQPRFYENTFAVRLGAQYKVNDDLNLMAGASYDLTPTMDTYTSPEAVDGNRWGYSVGLSYAPISRIKINAGLSYISVQPRDAIYTPANFGGTYQMKSLSPAFGISYNLTK